MNLCGQGTQLCTIPVVAREKDDAADERVHEPFAVFAAELVSVDTKDDGSPRHRRCHQSRCAAASRMSAFICWTASRKPVNMARDTMACPMWSSRTPASRATGCTLK